MIVSEVVTPEDRVSLAREAFLQAVEAHASEVLDTLAELVGLPLAEKLEAVQRWAARFNVDARWMRDQAVWTLHLWELGHWPEAVGRSWVDTSRSEQVSFEWTPDLPVSEDDCRFKAFWNPELESWPKARARIHAELEGWAVALVKQAQERGAKRPPRPRTRGDIDPGTRYRWLVEHRCLRLSQSDLAAGHGVHPSAVSRVCSELSELIGLPPLV
ncbi:MAG TPA: hypothetical protein PLS53_10570 [Thermoanaerobaculaceae bacterium]|nr:hypothetical protein [Thermoanaerobaculaceae bacterium]